VKSLELKNIFVGKDIPLNLLKTDTTSRSAHLNIPYSIIEYTKQLLDYLNIGDYEIIATEIAESSKSIKEIIIPLQK
jgi:hypothetical protein